MTPLTIDWLFHAVANRPTLPDRVLAVPGFSTPNLRSLLSSVCKFDGCNYLEVGTLHGASLIAASYLNSGAFWGIDDFSQFEGSRQKLFTNLHAMSPECSNIGFWEHDSSQCEPNENCGIEFNVFFYDGHHSEEITRDTIMRFDPILADRFLLIVDDYSWIGPRRGAEAALNAMPWNVECKIEIADNYNRRGFGIGLMLALVEKRK